VSEEPEPPDPEEVIRRNFVALNRRDFDGILATFAPDAVWETPGLEAQEGREAIRRLLEDWVGVYEDYEATLIEFRDLGRTGSPSRWNSRVGGREGVPGQSKPRRRW
jgi:ketosteroid isomerase-like protein